MVCRKTEFNHVEKLELNKENPVMKIFKKQEHYVQCQAFTNSCVDSQVHFGKIGNQLRLDTQVTEKAHPQPAYLTHMCLLKKSQLPDTDRLHPFDDPSRNRSFTHEKET